MTMASRIAVMSEGRIRQIGAPGEVYEAPKSRFVADFIGNVNLMDGRLIHNEVAHAVIQCADCIHHVDSSVVGAEGMAVTVALRPEKVTVSRNVPANADGAANRVFGTVKDMSYFGSFTVYHLQLGSGFVLKVSTGNTERQRAQPLTWGDEAWASWSSTSQVVLTA